MFNKFRSRRWHKTLVVVPRTVRPSVDDGGYGYEFGPPVKVWGIVETRWSQQMEQRLWRA